ncbi:hypothetical protein [Microbacterium esteraromaticum]|nr:hypothetical protein [Microbacterium esteraromaticum]MBY6060980.1 hypothetical protein [Microbacterium esteraromaticum]
MLSLRHPLCRRAQPTLSAVALVSVSDLAIVVATEALFVVALPHERRH